MKTVLMVPGYQEDLQSRDYASLLKAIESKGYKAVFVPITWQRKTIDDWVRELEAEYAKYNAEDVVLAGFSYGAMTAFAAAAKRNPSQLWLFSLSPYFAEDLASKHMNQSWLKNIGHRRVTAFGKLKFGQLAKTVQCKTLSFIGELEKEKFHVLCERFDDATAQLSHNTGIVIPGVGHEASHKDYIAAVQEAI
jgi:predicted alpha/beta-fold hydrolase